MISRKEVVLWGVCILTAGLALAGCGEDNRVQHECISPEASSSTFYIRDYSYSRNRIFDLGLVRDPAGDTLIRFLRPTDQITGFALYVATSGSNDLGVQPGIAYSYWPNPALGEMDSVRTTFKPVDQAQTPYDIHANADGWYLFFQHPQTTASGNTYAYALAYTRDGELFSIGNRSGDTLRLQLLHRPNSTPADPLWDAEWKNVYDLSYRGIDYDAFSLDIYKGALGTENASINLDHQGEVPYLQLLGLDETDRAGNPNTPDGMIDNNPMILNLDLGLLIFPDRRPFDTDISYAVDYPGVLLDPRVPAIYDSPNFQEQQYTSTYYIAVTIPGRPAEFDLGRVHLIPESETVTFDGRPLTRGIDYSLDYEFGRISFLSDAALYPNGQLDICYDYCP